MPAAAAHQGRSRGGGRFPKRLSRTVDRIHAAHPGATVKVWAQDEHRLGLKPVQRRVWLLPDMERIAPVWPRYEWCYVSGWVRPETGASYWLLVPRIGTDVYSQLLAEFAGAHGLGRDKHIVPEVDQAGWHRSSKVVLPAGLHLEFLPPYALELQPAERLWALIDQAVANRVVATLDELLDELSARCRVVQSRTLELARRTCFHWWPRQALASGVIIWISYNSPQKRHGREHTRGLDSCRRIGRWLSI
jgi:transposase